MKLKQTLIPSLIGMMVLGMIACDKDESKPSVGAFFVSVNGESAEYIMQIDTLESGSYSIASNFKEMESTDYQWIFGGDPNVAIGLIYNQADPAVAVGMKVNELGTIEEMGEFQLPSRFTNYGFFGQYALTSVGGQTPVDANGNAMTDANGVARTDGVTVNFIDLKSNLALEEKAITTLNITGNGNQATISGFADMGNGEFLTALVCSSTSTSSGGSSTGAVTYPDSVWVAAFDKDLNLKRIYRDDRISYASGRYRSRYYSMISKADDDYIYVFSGSYESASTRPCGALRIKQGATEFDKDYYFNIEELSGGYHFRRLWHITGTYFLLVFYNEFVVSTSGATTQFAIVNMEDKSFSWLKNFPAKEEISDFGDPMSYNGKMYLPITVSGADPAIYIIDPKTANANKGVSFTGASTINAIGRLSAE